MLINSTHVYNSRIPNNSVKNCARGIIFVSKMNNGFSPCYSKLICKLNLLLNLCNIQRYTKLHNIL